MTVTEPFIGQPPALQAEEPNPTITVGLHGFQGSGKDTCAEILVREQGFQQVAFADALKEYLLVLDPLILNHDLASTRRLSFLVEQYGWDEIKSNPSYGGEVRRLLKYFGTEVAQRLAGSDIWVRQADRRANCARVVFSDVRFEHESDYVRSRGGVLINVVRPGHGPQDNHASEQSIKCDLTVRNDGDIDDLAHKLSHIISAVELYARRQHTNNTISRSA